MPHFTLTLKKKKDNGKVAEKSITGNNITTILGLTSPRRAPSQDLKAPAVFKPNGPEYIAPRKPLLKINTKLTNNITPPPSPNGESTPCGWDRRASVPIISSQTTTPPQTPSPISPTSQRRMSLPSPIHFFQTPGRRRKLKEIREGKKPAIHFDEESADTPPQTSDDDSSVLTEICDPSSSTTYSPKNRSRRHTSNPESPLNSLPSPVNGFELSY